MNNSNPWLNPEGGDGVWRADREPALDNLRARILARDNVQTAWKRVKSNQGAPGSDGMTLEDFPAYAREHWQAIRQSLSDGSDQPRPVRRVVIPKPRGKGERKLGVPCVVDRVLQQAILQVLTPLFDPEVSASSVGSRPKRCAHGAIRQVKTFVKAGYQYAVDLDLEPFFDTVNHDVLMSRLARTVTDKVLLGLIGRYLRAGVLVGSTVEPTDWGTPQGSPLSPLLSNIRLDDLDKELEARGLRFVRYVDDVVNKSQKQTSRATSDGRDQLLSEPEADAKGELSEEPGGQDRRTGIPGIYVPGHSDFRE